MSIGQRWPEAEMPKCQVIFARALYPYIQLSKSKGRSSWPAFFSLAVLCMHCLYAVQDLPLGRLIGLNLTLKIKLTNGSRK